MDELIGYLTMRKSVISAHAAEDGVPSEVQSAMHASIAEITHILTAIEVLRASAPTAKSGRAR